MATPAASSSGLIWPLNGFASAGLAATGDVGFLPLPAGRHSSRDNKAALARPPLTLRASGCVTVRHRTVDRHRERGRRGPDNSQRIMEKMATIGTFKKTANGEFTGEIVTLTLQARGIRIIPQDNRNSDNAPSHRVLAGRAEIGACWHKVSTDNRSYLAVKLDDPSFNAPIYANLFEDDEEYSLVWSRPNGRRNGG